MRAIGDNLMACMAELAALVPRSIAQVVPSHVSISSLFASQLTNMERRSPCSSRSDTPHIQTHYVESNP